jgi:uncharacterized protein YoaH (UPF0181 family)
MTIAKPLDYIYESAFEKASHFVQLAAEETSDDALEIVAKEIRAIHRDALQQAKNSYCAADLLAALRDIIKEAGPEVGKENGPDAIGRIAYLARQAVAKSEVAA